MKSITSNRKRLLVFIGVFIASFILNSAHAQKIENTLLWKMEGNGIKPSYLFGTFHLLPQEDFELKEKVKLAFEKCEQLVMELDMDDPNMQAEMMKNMQMKDGNTLDQFMTEEDLKLLDEQLKAAVNLTAAQVNTFKPFMVETFLLPSFIKGTPASYEITFVQMAMSSGKAIEGLEEISDQTKIFDEIPYQDQVEDLIDILRNRENMEAMFETMIAFYKEEQVSKLYKMSLDYFNEEEIELLLHKRNIDWIDRMKSFSTEKSTFFAVGAGHLGGKQGVVQLLKDAGYEVTPVLE